MAKTTIRELISLYVFIVMFISAGINTQHQQLPLYHIITLNELLPTKQWFTEKGLNCQAGRHYIS